MIPRPATQNTTFHMIGMLLFRIVLLSFFAAQPALAVTAMPTEMAAASQWVTDKLAGGSTTTELPFSFTYNGEASAVLLKSWELKRSERQLDASRKETTLTYTDPKTGLILRCVAVTYRDFPAVEWILYFKNAGEINNTPILSNIRALDSGLPLKRDRTAVVHYANGSECRVDDFAPMLAPLGPTPVAPQAPWIETKNALLLGSKEGRSSCGMLPFFNVDAGTEGVIAAIGWTGDWTARVYRTASEVRLDAGMGRTHLKLLPGEEIRTPRILLLFWTGERMHGHNLLRQFVLAHYSPKIDGRPARVPVSLATWGGNYAEKHIAHARWFKENKLPLDFLWVDAGWYGNDETRSGADVFNSKWSKLVGDWFPNPSYFPRGLEPVGQALKALDIGFLLWFEPERVRAGTKWAREHPEFLLGPDPTGTRFLFDLGNPAARLMATEHQVGLIRDGNISCYRQDFNLNPRPFWDAADAPDRVGIAEIRYITGLYQFWDDLLTRCPGLLIDNCASGGRRIDLETMSRSLPLWRSDVPSFPGFGVTAMQGQTHGLGLWVPLSAGVCDQENTYMFRSGLGSGMVLIMAEFEKDSRNHFSLDWLRTRLDELNQVRDYFLGDFYPLLSFTLAEDSWAAWQYDRPDLGAGVVLVFRRPQSPLIEAKFPLKGLEAESIYEFRDTDSGALTLLSGKECLERGLYVAMPDKPASRLFIYRKQSRPTENGSAR
jgi:alpha-galactosidase